MNRDPLDHDADPDADGRLAALFARDRGPEPQELAAARLLLKRELARRLAQPTLLPAPRRTRPRVLAFLAQAAGFALLIALLVPTLRRVAPSAATWNATNTPRADLVASLADGVRALGTRVGRLLPELPPLELDATLPDAETIDRALAPIRSLGDELPAWWPSLHSDAR